MRAAVHLALMALVAAGLALAMIAGGSPGEARLDLDSGLLVSTRRDFQVCVEVAQPLQPRRAALVDALRAALERVRGHRDWAGAGLGAGPPSITLGCPEQRPPQVGAHSPSGGRAAQPSPYRLWVYVLDAATADRRFGPDVGAASVAAEYLADGDHGRAEVSTAVLVRAGYLADPAFAGNELAAAVGLQPVGPEPAPLPQPGK